MAITKRKLDQAFIDYGSKYYGCKEDYFALLYISESFGKEIEEIAPHVAFGGNDYGLDGFHIDPERKNLYLFQFKWSENHNLFRDSFKRLIDAGIERIFGDPLQDPTQNQLLIQLKTAIDENQSIIDRVYIHFIYNGDPTEAERSKSLEALREDLESKKYLIDQYFGHQINLTFQFISNETKIIAGQRHQKKTHIYQIYYDQKTCLRMPTGELLYVGFMKLMDLFSMHKEMGHRLFERNIRASLSPDQPPNRSIRKGLKLILDGEDPPEVFAFNHNGIAIACEDIEFEDGTVKITEPRILNGAQTVTSLVKFMEDNKDNSLIRTNKGKLESILVLSKIICKSNDSFVANVTIYNNKQNPVEPWHLRASDQIQLEFQDKFREDLGIYYERQENAFRGLQDSELDEMGVQQNKAIQIKKLAQTFLAIQGDLDKMSRLRDVFENDNTYKNTFRNSYLRADSRKIVLAYKVQSGLRRFKMAILERGNSKYDYIDRASNLVWALLIQGALNVGDLEDLCENHGSDLVLTANFSEWMKDMASSRVRLIIKNAIDIEERYKQMIQEERYSFLRTKAIFDRCMDVAYDRYDWKKRSI